MATPAQHQEISERFLSHAQEEFEKGDQLQASEKAWGAVAHYVQSVAKERGWQVGSHRNTIENAARLIELSSDPAGNRTRLSAIIGLHANFYEVHMPERLVEQGIEDARDLLTALKEAASLEEQTYQPPEFIKATSKRPEGRKAMLFEINGERIYEDPDEELIEGTLGNLCPSGDGYAFAILSRVDEPSMYIQTSVSRHHLRQDKYSIALEYQDGHEDMHYRCDDEIDIEDLKSAFISFLKSDGRWRSDFEWSHMTI